MTLVLLEESEGSARIVSRVREGEAQREDVLRDLLFAQPAMLPVAEIDPAIGPLVPIARELNVPDVGRIDAFLADGRGHLVIVECKLWRNPQARREVVGQILDYARALARFSVALPPLDIANVGSVDASPVGVVLLAPPSLLAETTHIYAEALTNVHGPSTTPVSAIILQTISDIGVDLSRERSLLSRH